MIKDRCKVKPKVWVEARIEVPSSLAEGVSNFLIELGSPGVAQETSPGKKGRKKESILAYFLNPSSFVGPKKKIRKLHMPCFMSNIANLSYLFSCPILADSIS